MTTNQPVPALLIRCPHCNEPLDHQFLATASGKLRASMRTSFGKHKLLRPCPFGCGQEFGAREMRDHVVICEKKVSKPAGRPRKIPFAVEPPSVRVARLP